MPRPLQMNRVVTGDQHLLSIEHKISAPNRQPVGSIDHDRPVQSTAKCHARIGVVKIDRIGKANHRGIGQDDHRYTIGSLGNRHIRDVQEGKWRTPHRRIFLDRLLLTGEEVGSAPAALPTSRLGPFGQVTPGPGCVLRWRSRGKVLRRVGQRPGFLRDHQQRRHQSGIGAVQAAQQQPGHQSPC